VTIEHKGAVNAQSAVDWMMSNLPSPEVVLVTGCSAGAYGSLFWTAKIAPFYLPKGTRLVQFGDSGMGIVTEEFVREAYPQWNTAEAFPWEIVPSTLQGGRTNAEFAANNMSFLDFYYFAADTFPTVQWSQYSSAYDQNQAFFLATMVDDSYPQGEPPLADKLAWAALMRTQMADHAALLALPNYAHWIGAGDEHCVVPYNRYWWTVGPSGAKLSGWVEKMIEGHDVTTVDCASIEACTVGLEQ
tara:strand:- start:179 stop:910 length:732 start_codon:yes stop_codon:yes gene_type:complete